MVSVIGFFVLAGIGWLSGLTPEGCALRAAGGAIVLFVVISIASRLMVNIVASAMSSRRSSAGEVEGTRGRRS